MRCPRKFRTNRGYPNATRLVLSARVPRGSSGRARESSEGSARVFIAMSSASCGHYHRGAQPDGCPRTAPGDNQQNRLRSSARCDWVTRGHNEPTCRGWSAVSRSLCRSLGKQSLVSRGDAGRSNRSRKPVWAISPSGVRIPPSPSNTVDSQHWLGTRAFRAGSEASRPRSTQANLGLIRRPVLSPTSGQLT
jgi:hypothetical protein